MVKKKITQEKSFEPYNDKQIWEWSCFSDLF